MSALKPHGNATAPAEFATVPVGSATAPAGNATALNGNAIVPVGRPAPAETATAPGEATVPGGAATAPAAEAMLLTAPAATAATAHTVKGMRKSARALMPGKKTTFSKPKLPVVGATSAWAAVDAGPSTMATVTTKDVASAEHGLQPSQTAAQAQLQPHALTQAQPQLSMHSLIHTQSQLLFPAHTHAQPQLSTLVPTSARAQLSQQMPTQAAILAAAHNTAPAPAQGVAALVAKSAHAPFVEASLSQAPVLTASSAPPSQAELHPQAELPVTVVGLTAKVNSMLTGLHQLSQQQAEQMQAAFGDVKLMQDLRHMGGIC